MSARRRFHTDRATAPGRRSDPARGRRTSERRSKGQRPTLRRIAHPSTSPERALPLRGRSCSCETHENRKDTKQNYLFRAFRVLRAFRVRRESPRSCSGSPAPCESTREVILVGDSRLTRESPRCTLYSRWRSASFSGDRSHSPRSLGRTPRALQAGHRYSGRQAWHPISRRARRRSTRHCAPPSGCSRLRHSFSPSLRDPNTHGDQFVEVQVVLPKVISEETKELLRKYGQMNTENPRVEMGLE